jgi:hemerythrin-like domain-containing protein
MPNVLNLLKEDHKKVRGLLEQLEHSTDRASKRRVQLLEQIEQELLVHAQLEQEIVYAAFRDAARKKDDEKLYYEALEEHRGAVSVLEGLKQADPASSEFAGKAKVLKDMVLHHVQEEEHELFPRARTLFAKEELDELGKRVQLRKEELMGSAGVKKSARKSSERRAHA